MSDDTVRSEQQDDGDGETQQDDGRLRVVPSELASTSPRKLLTRFGAGAGASLVAALVSTVGSPRASGPLLALPAILLASLTLVIDDKGPAAARDDARGAAVGAVGLVAFAVVAALLLDRTPTWLALVSATVVWVAVSVGLFLLQREVLRRVTGNDDGTARDDEAAG